MKFKKGDLIKDENYISIILKINKPFLTFKDVYTLDLKKLLTQIEYEYRISDLKFFKKLTKKEKLELL